MKYHSKPVLVRIKQRSIVAKISQIFGEFLVNFRQTVGDFYLKEYPTTLVLPLLAHLHLQITRRFTVLGAIALTAYKESTQQITNL